MRYTIGFMFSKDKQKVALIRKIKPEWQKGKLNAIGGKIKYNETSIQSICREFEEETGYKTTQEQWNYFAQMIGNPDGGKGPSSVDCFCTIGDLDYLISKEEEKIEIIETYSYSMLIDMLSNTFWLMHLAIDNLNDGQPQFTIINYITKGD
jgi:8-oxo-dGTP pyrophosphatase MutT (NUDIX family)